MLQSLCEPHSLVSCWRQDFAYEGGERVFWKGRLYRAQWWTQGEEPGMSGECEVWTDEGPDER